MTVILDGKKLRDELLDELKNKLSSYNVIPKLVVILVGENPASRIYVNNKKKTAEKLGINSEVIVYPADISEKELLAKIEELNVDNSVNAILVQLPLPAHIDKSKVINAISPLKDVDGFTPENSGKLLAGENPYVYPCTPKGILLLLDKYGIEVDGKHVVIVGRSNIVGKPLAVMLLNRNATVTVCHSHTKNLSEITKTADILISAVGEKLIEDNMVKMNCVIVDVGIFKDINGKTRGDVDFEKVYEKTSYISPVPGGVGPMTIASLMLNTVELFDLQTKRSCD
ncbi:TPA: bifunctional methylenetetrahydrofolate dehydrogenase/methenyltetrahydrofolate cyclohydrolase [Candidatus Scatousia excrementigallinarum]|uniref:Bifunctional protein FolD n=1 Tax=Candidatus Scatousia excrementigallinarum TaxID=2840935 RepID=A0A9D1F161_9BACT|nr:bifunctional methylenetetrahydrofolate dehydrogenase/methenyltetrahydrofolate cyclohydrolase [Candidatus Scatousia excrementigallinarum]